MTQGNKWLVLIATGLAGIMVAADFTIVNTCLSLIQKDLGSTVNQLQWLISGFGISFCALLATAGRAGDLFGHRKLLYIAIIGFSLASLGSGLSTTPLMLIIFRILQGAFSAIVFPCGMAINANNFPKEEQGRAFSLYGSLVGIGLAFGPLMGSLISSFASWRWIFFINIPLTIISLVLCFLVVKKDSVNKNVKIDWLGMCLLIFSLATLVFAINEGPYFGWETPITISLFIAAGIGFWLLYQVEKRVEAPILPIPLFMNRGFLVGNIVYVIGVGFAWPILFFLPLFLHDVQNYKTLMVGLLILPMTAMTAIAPVIAGNIYDKYNARVAVAIMFLFAFIAYILFLLFNINVPVWFMLIAFFIFGSAWGFGNGLGIPIMLSDIEDMSDAGVISGAGLTILNICGVLSLAIVTTIFYYAERDGLKLSLQKANIQLTEHQQHLVQAMIANPDRVKSLLSGFSKDLAEKIVLYFKQAFVHGFHISIWTLLGGTIISLLIILKANQGKRG